MFSAQSKVDLLLLSEAVRSLDVKLHPVKLELMWSSELYFDFLMVDDAELLRLVTEKELKKPKEELTFIEKAVKDKTYESVFGKLKLDDVIFPKHRLNLTSGCITKSDFFSGHKITPEDLEWKKVNSKGITLRDISEGVYRMYSEKDKMIDYISLDLLFEEADTYHFVVNVKSY